MQRLALQRWARGHVDGCAQSRGTDQCDQPISQAQPNVVKVIFQAESGKEISLNIKVTPEVRLSETQTVTSKNHGSNHARIATDERDAGLHSIGRSIT